MLSRENSITSIEKRIADVLLELNELLFAYSAHVDVESAILANVITMMLLERFPDAADRPRWQRK